MRFQQLSFCEKAQTETKQNSEPGKFWISVECSVKCNYGIKSFAQEFKC